MAIGYSIVLILFYLHIGFFCFLRRPWIDNPSDRKKLFLLFLLAFCLRLSMALFVTCRHGEFYPDEGFYFREGVRITEELQFPYVQQVDDLVLRATSPNFGYLVFNAFHCVIYADAFLCKITNCFIGAFLLLPVYCLARKLFSRRVAISSAVITALWPNLIWWSAVNLKDILVAFLIVSTILLYYLCRSDRMTVFNLVALALAILILLALRLYVGLLFIGLLTVHFIMVSDLGKVKKVIGMLLLLLFIFVIGRTGYIGNWLGDTMNMETAIELSKQSFSQAAGHGYSMGNFNPESFLTLPISAAHFLFTPSPFRIKFESIKDFIAFNNVVWYGMFPFFVIGAYNFCKSRFKDAFLIVFFVLGLVLFYSFFPNLGMVRHRDQIAPLLIIIAVSGFYNRVKYKVAIVWVIWLGLFAGILSFEMKYYFDLV
jgi:4-amino-4-deoxy-L-arabinose transferase-like glycosyltransferase